MKKCFLLSLVFILYSNINYANKLIKYRPKECAELSNIPCNFKFTKHNNIVYKYNFTCYNSSDFEKAKQLLNACNCYVISHTDDFNLSGHCDY